ncbi:MAG TPA: hypothetical protein VHI54_08995 [Actinomycetota bacterium]|nr:hypothetical protein [Actinomycetota bacterium]
MDAKVFIRAVLLVLCLVLAAPAVIWLVTTTSLEVVALSGLGVLSLIVLGALAFLLQWRFWAWFMGAVAVLLTPGLLKLGAQFIVGDARAAMEAWIYVYAAGAVGGLLLDLIRGKGGLEFPSAELPVAFRTVPTAPVASPPVANGGEPVSALPGPIGPIGPVGPAPPATADAPPAPTVVTTPTPSVPQSAAFVASEAAPENGTGVMTEGARERGARIDIGFFSRVTMGGLAAAATIIVVRIIVGDTQPAHFLASALRLDTLAGAVLVGMLAPALWSGTQTLVESRFSFMKGAMDTAVAAVANAEQAVRAARDAGLSPAGPDAPQFIVDAAPLRSPEFIATIAREEDPTEVGKMLLTRINSARIDLGAVQAQQEAQLGQALGSLETAERLLRSALGRVSRR